MGNWINDTIMMDKIENSEPLSHWLPIETITYVVLGSSMMVLHYFQQVFFRVMSFSIFTLV